MESEGDRLKNLKNRLKEGFNNCYLIQGEDYELFLRGYSMILKRANLSIPEFNLARFDDENYSMKGVIDACQVLPMGDEWRIVLLKNVEKISENDKKMMLEYLKMPTDSTILIIFDLFNKFSALKDLKDVVCFVDCKRFDKATAISVVVNELAKRNKQISTEGANCLIDYCNGYLTRVMSEIDKLVYYDLNDPLITKKIIDQLVSKDDEVVIYQLTEALGQKNGDRALNLLEALKKESGILGLITNHFRRLFFISISGLDDKELARLLSVKEFAIKKQREQCKNFSKMQLKKIYALLEEIDYGIKSGAFLQESALQFLVLSILYI